MTTPNDSTDNELMPDEIIDRFMYHPSLLHRWLEQLGIKTHDTKSWSKAKVYNNF